MPRHRPDRRPRDLLVRVRDQPAERVRERQGLPLRETGRLEARPPTGRARLADHRLEERLRRLESLPQPGQHGHHRGAHREVGVVSQIAEASDRVHVRVAREVEEGLRPHLEVRVAKQRLRPRHDRPVAGLVQDRQGAAAHLGVAVVEEAAHRGVGGGRLAAHRHEVEGVEDLAGIHGPEPGGDHLGRLPVESHRGGTLGVEPVLPQAFPQRVHVTPVHPGGLQEPAGR